jgi:hypothetical protein
VPEYTIAAVAAAVAVVVWEVRVLRTGLLRTRAYRLTMAIVFGFQCLVDGWLRAPWDIPVEDFLYGFALLTLVLLRWEVAARRGRAGSPRTAERVGRIEG